MFFLTVSGQIDPQIEESVQGIIFTAWGRSACILCTLAPRKGNAFSGLGLERCVACTFDHSLSWTLCIYCLPSVRSVTLGDRKSNSENNKKTYQAFELPCSLATVNQQSREPVCESHTAACLRSDTLNFVHSGKTAAL